LTGIPPGQVRFSPAKILRKSTRLTFVNRLSEFTTTAISVACAADRGIKAVTQPSNKTAINFLLMLGLKLKM
jgi:hypothetical protein